MPRSLAIATLVLIAACGGQTGATTTSSTTTTEATTTTEVTSPTVDETTTTTVGLTTTTAAEYDFILEGGTKEIPEIVVHGPDRVVVSPGDEVSLTVFSSVNGDLHLHGYDLHFQLTAGEVTEVVLTADVPGIFEAELEENHQLIFELEVSP